MSKKSAILLYRQLGWSTEVLLVKNSNGDWDLPHDDGISSSVFHASKSISKRTGINFPTTLRYLGQFRPTINDKIMGYMRDFQECELSISRKANAKFFSLREALFIVDPTFVPLLENFYAKHSLEYKRHCA